MKKIFILVALAAALLCMASCETYKVDEPDMTRVAWLDGRYLAVALNPANQTDTLSVFDIEITNTTEDESDRAWMTITDWNLSHSLAGSPGYPFAIRFDFSCSKADKSFSCESADGFEPSTCYNAYYEQGYYTSGYFASVRRIRSYQNYKVTVTGGQIVANGVNTATGYKADSIEFTISYVNVDDASDAVTALVRGMKYTGWAEDTAVYAQWVERAISN